MEVTVAVTKGHDVIAADDFETGGWTGGTGWLQDWDHYGLSAITSSSVPQQGTYHLMLNGNTDYVARSFDFTPARDSYARLYFWAKAKSFQSGEVVNLRLSTDGVNWTTLKTWGNGDDDNAYRFYDIDLSQYTDNARLWIAFEAGMSGPNSYFYVDSVSVVKKLQGSVLSSPSDNFESGDWLGGYHWLGGWAHSGSTSITPRSPYQGQYHLEMKGPSSYAERAADLSDFDTARAQLWAQSSHFGLTDSVDLRVSGDGVAWYSLTTWTIDDSDWTYRPVDVDIPRDALTDQFRLAFYTNLSSSSQFIDVDNLQIWGSAYVYEIVATAGNTSATAVVSVVDEDVIVHSWRTARRGD